jgi:ABC-type antimicrobial peptide transport system ATPase subunit
MHEGELVEQGTPTQVFDHPENEHTLALVERYRSGKTTQPVN